MKQVVAILMFLVLSLSVSAAGGAMVKASVLRYEPTPGVPGQALDVWVQLTNEGTDANRVGVKFVPEFPFSLPLGAKGEVELGVLAATESKVQKFTVFVDDSAPNGDNMIKFQFKYGSDQWTELETPISLQAEGAVLVVDSYKVVPSPIVPGQTVIVELGLRNAGRLALKNVDVSIDLEDGKFSTIGTGAKQRVNYIPVGEVEKVTFSLASDTSTEVKVYNVPVTLSYQDERGSKYDDTAKISLVVNAKPEISLTVDSTDFADKKSAGDVSLKVVNKGVVNMKYVTVTLVPFADYEVLSPSNEAYVGNLDSDDFETVSFTLKPLVDSPRLKVQLDFKDPYNVDFSQQYDLPLRIITDKDLGKGKSPVGTIMIVLIIAGVVFWYWRRRKKAKR